MTWNQNTGKKPYLQKDDETLKIYGQPVFDNHRAIGVRQYFPEKGYDQYFTGYVHEKGGAEFFSSPTWRDDLFRLLQEMNRDHPLGGRYETDEEYHSRLLYELETSKNIIRQKLDKEVRFLCWPGG